MRAYRNGILSAFAAFALLAAAPQPVLAEEGGEMTWEQVKDYGVEKKDAFVAWHRRQMRALEEQYEKAEKKMKQAGDKAGKEWEGAKKDVARARDAMAKKLDAAGDATKKGWTRTKKEVAQSYEAAKKAYDRALDKAKTKE